MSHGLLPEEDGDGTGELAEINVTPFIDVMLVLLIIFMVAAPLATVDVPVDLPRSTAAPAPKPEAPVYVTLARDGTLSVGNTPLPAAADDAALTRALAEATAGGPPDQRLFLRADREVDYGALIELMNRLRAAGHDRVALVGLDAAPVRP